MSVNHWMTFGTFAEQRYFIYPNKDAYYGVIINANMAAHAPDGLAAFLLEKTAEYRYIIDPVTHAFQHDPSAVTDSNGVVRSSIRKMAEAYGEPFVRIVGEEPLRPRVLADKSATRDFVKRCLDFQREQLARPMAEADALKYLDPGTDLRPFALVAPYFYMTETTLGQWIPVSRLCVEMALDLKGECRLFACIVVGQGVVTNSKARNEIVARFGSLGVDGFLLWVDDLDEYEAGTDELSGLLDLARRLGGNGKRQVINLHGGYFSILGAGVLGNGALTGVAHGPEFGEHRAVVPVGGGIPIARYYIPKLHHRTRYRDALAILRAKKWLSSSAKDFHTNVCGCDACKQALQGDVDNFSRFGESIIRTVKRKRGMVRMAFPTSDAKLFCLMHYLQVKQAEYAFAGSASKRQVLDELRAGRALFEDAAGLEGVAHLERWEQVLSGSS